jgi:hypothetical protein
MYLFVRIFMEISKSNKNKVIQTDSHRKMILKNFILSKIGSSVSEIYPSVLKKPVACFTKELTITIKFYPVHYSLIWTNLKTILIVLKRI